MMKLATLVSSSVLVLGLIVNGVYSWGYEGAEGSAHWGEEYKKCEGLKQSPINIDTSKVKVNHDLTFEIKGLDMRHKSHIKNNGHSVQLELLDSPKPTLTGSVVDNKVYIFAQLHFHWGKTSSRGSEHSINSHFYPEEMHMVFYNEKYGDFTTASTYADGLVVIGTFFKNATFNYNFQPLLYAVHQVKELNSDVKLPEMVTFRQLLPKNIKKFYTYSGSLTTPPCDESVTWIVLAEPISFSEKQLETFRHEKTNHISHETGTNEIVYNYRDQAKLGDRIVQASFVQSLDL